MAVPDAVLRRKLFQASTEHRPVFESVKLSNEVHGSWMRVSCSCGWGGSGLALHEHQMDELVKAVRSAYAADQLALSRLTMLVEDFPDDAVPTISIARVQAILSGDISD